MNEEPTTSKPVEEATSSAQEVAGSAKSETAAIMDELGKLGQKVTVALQQVWDSEERKKAEDEIRKALRIAGDRIDEVAVDVRSSDVTKDLKGQASKTMTAVQQSPITQDIRKGFLTGLRRLNEEISDFLEREKDVASTAGDAAKEAGEKVSEAAKDVQS